jgi:beta-mannosidase
MKRVLIQSPEEEAILGVEVWACNTTVQAHRVDILISSWNIITGELISTKVALKNVILESNRTTELIGDEAPFQSSIKGGAEQIVYAAYLIEKGTQIARHVNWPEPLKHVHLQSAKAIDVKLSRDKTVIELSTDVPVKGVQVESPELDVKFDNNGIDLVPGETVAIGVSGLSNAKSLHFSTRHLGM